MVRKWVLSKFMEYEDWEIEGVEGMKENVGDIWTFSLVFFSWERKSWRKYLFVVKH